MMMWVLTEDSVASASFTEKANNRLGFKFPFQNHSTTYQKSSEMGSNIGTDCAVKESIIYDLVHWLQARTRSAVNIQNYSPWFAFNLQLCTNGLSLFPHHLNGWDIMTLLHLHDRDKLAYRRKRGLFSLNPSFQYSYIFISPEAWFQTMVVSTIFNLTVEYY